MHEKIAFTSDRNGHVAVYTMRPNGKKVRKVTPDFLEGGDASWSPDGEQIAFDNFSLDVPGSGEVYVVDQDDENRTNITNEPGTNDFHPDWAPEGEDD